MHLYYLSSILPGQLTNLSRLLSVGTLCIVVLPSIKDLMVLHLESCLLFFRRQYTVSDDSWQLIAAPII
jgi:hypothetical protein